MVGRKRHDRYHFGRYATGVPAPGLYLLHSTECLEMQDAGSQCPYGALRKTTELSESAMSAWEREGSESAQMLYIRGDAIWPLTRRVALEETAGALHIPGVLSIYGGDPLTQSKTGLHTFGPAGTAFLDLQEVTDLRDFLTEVILAHARNRITPITKKGPRGR